MLFGWVSKCTFNSKSPEADNRCGEVSTSHKNSEQDYQQTKVFHFTRLCPQGFAVVKLSTSNSLELTFTTSVTVFPLKMICFVFTWISCYHCAWPMASTLWTFRVVTYDFYRLCFTESSTLVWKYTNVERKCVIKDVAAVLFLSCFQIWSKQVNNNIEKSMRQDDFFIKHRPFPVLFFRVMSSDDVSLGPCRYFHFP